MTRGPLSAMEEEHEETIVLLQDREVISTLMEATTLIRFAFLIPHHFCGRSKGLHAIYRERHIQSQLLQTFSVMTFDLRIGL